MVEDKVEQPRDEESWSGIVGDLLGGLAGLFGRDPELRDKIVEGLSGTPSDAPLTPAALTLELADLQQRLKKLEARVKKLERGSKK
jgi:hypothetical protein